jgi:hypothetical protein
MCWNRPLLNKISLSSVVACGGEVIITVSTNCHMAVDEAKLNAGVRLSVVVEF